jgi:hypothetical protein
MESVLHDPAPSLRPSSELLGYSQVSLWDKDVIYFQLLISEIPRSPFFSRILSEIA